MNRTLKIICRFFFLLLLAFTHNSHRHTQFQWPYFILCSIFFGRIVFYRTRNELSYKSNWFYSICVVRAQGKIIHSFFSPSLCIFLKMPYKLHSLHDSNRLRALKDWIFFSYLETEPMSSAIIFNIWVYSLAARIFYYSTSPAERNR